MKMNTEDEAAGAIIIAAEKLTEKFYELSCEYGAGIMASALAIMTNNVFNSIHGDMTRNVYDSLSSKLKERGVTTVRANLTQKEKT